MSNYEYPSQSAKELFTHARYEVLPTPKIGDQVREHVPRDVTVTVTASPAKGLEDTFALAETLARDGFDAVPHLAARMIAGRGHLEEIVARLRAAGVRKVFVPAGDAAEPAGDYASALDLLADLQDLGSPFEHVGITAYPESHPSIDDDVTVQAMWDKRTYATHLVSNMTFDAERVAAWTERVRRRGIDLPLIVGVPGPVDPTKLLGMATKIGVGDSMRFLKKQRRVFALLATPGFTTDRFVSTMAALTLSPHLRISGLHIYTFNQVEVVETWRQKQLTKLDHADDILMPKKDAILPRRRR